jgi:hypothetical protein
VRYNQGAIQQNQMDCQTQRGEELSVFTQNPIRFLSQKKDELNVLLRVWEAAREGGFYRKDARIACEKVKLAAKRIGDEIEPLDQSLKRFLSLELTRDPSSEKTIRLSKMVIATECAKTYVDSLLNTNCHPTFLREGLHTFSRISNYTLIGTGLLTGLVYLADRMFADKVAPPSVYGPVKVSLLACIGINAIRILNQFLRVDKSEVQMKNAKARFENALCSIS